MNKLENKKEYEMSYLLSAEIPEEKLDSEAAELKSVIIKNGAEVTQIDPLEKRRLAYPIKKQNQAYFGIVYFNIDKDELDKIKKALTLQKKVLRFLILNKAIKPKPSAAPAPVQSFDQKLESILKG
jgi:small subunit ribosomal protein S6